MMTMSELCSESFFTYLGTIIQEPLGSFIRLQAKYLNLHMTIHYPDLLVLKNVEDKDPDDLATYVNARFGTSMAKVYAALTAEYDPLANTSVTETEVHTGSDTNRRTGTDTTSQTGHNTTHYSTSFDEPSDEKETGKTTFSGTGSVQYGRTDTLEHGESVTKTKDGNIGVMPTQDLVKLEYYNRIKMTMFEFITTCLCICFSSQVWRCDDDN